MKLSYRGVNYDFNSSLQYRGAKHRLNEVAKARSLGAILTYRGAAYALEPNTQNVSAAASASPAVLTYRGVSYTVQPTVQTASVSAASVETVSPAVTDTVKAPVRSLQDQTRTLMMNHRRALKNRQHVMLARSAAEIGMTTAAVSHWEHNQETFNPAF